LKDCKKKSAPHYNGKIEACDNQANNFMEDNMKVIKQQKNWRNIGFCLSVSFLVLGTILLAACDNASLSEDGALAAKSASRSVRAATPIYDEFDLAAINGNPGGDYILEADLTLEDWTPICQPNNAFTGTFDGNGHTITVTGFSAAALAGANPIGIFSQVGSGLAGNSIHDLDVVLSDTLSISTPARFVGGLAGKAVGSSTALAAFSNIRVSGVLNAEYTGVNLPYPEENGFQIGGIVGRAEQTEINGCRSAVTVIGNANGANGAYNTSAGGIAGYVLNTAITGSSATGNISLSTLAATPIDWNNAWQNYAGGLVGYQGEASSIYRSFAEGNVSATAPFPYAGGLAGYNYGYNDFVNPPTLGSSILQCYATGAVTATAQGDSTTGNIPYAGGLVGYSSILQSIINNSYATGNVTAVSTGQFVWAGGIIGGNAQNSVVSRCYATGTVTVINGSLPPLYAPDYTEAGAAAGGIAGYNYYTPDTLIQYCAALNEQIDASGASPYLLHRVAGGIGTTAGYQGTLIDNIANREMELLPGAIVRPDPNGLDGESCPSNPIQTVYESLGWNFGSVWIMGSSGLPVLQWQ
jgi:hypothetical protein